MPLPETLLSQFSIVFMDPPYTRAGQLLFLKRAMTAIIPDPRSALFLCASRLYLTPSDLRCITKSATSGGFELKRHMRDFNSYQALPDIAEDLRRQNSPNCSYLKSDLFEFRPNRLHALGSIEEPDHYKIYDYSQHGSD